LNGGGSRSFPENQNLENEYGFAVQMKKVTTSLQQAFLNRARIEQKRPVNQRFTKLTLRGFDSLQPHH
jgi:hypothetical protein